MKFIQLHERSGRAFTLNAEHIISLTEFDGYTVIHTPGELTFDVRETVAEVIALAKKGFPT